MVGKMLDGPRMHHWLLIRDPMEPGFKYMWALAFAVRDIAISFHRISQRLRLTLFSNRGVLLRFFYGLISIFGFAM
jgi:hypothetical protein